MILVIDNYDSFVYNLVQYIGEVAAGQHELLVKRNDSLDLAEIIELKPQAIVLSPGPCTPNEAGICVPLVRQLAGHVPILGICLGHQSIGQAFGAKIVRADKIVHGKTSLVEHDGFGVFANLEQDFVATRYHSLVIEKESMPECLEISAQTHDGEIMAVRHREFTSIIGVQFHPESILTLAGKQLLANFLQLVERTNHYPLHVQ